MSTWPNLGGGCLTVYLQQTICLAMDILYLVECSCSFYLDFMWYLPLRGIAVLIHNAQENLSGRAYSVLCVMSLFI